MSNLDPARDVTAFCQINERAKMGHAGRTIIQSISNIISSPSGISRSTSRLRRDPVSLPDHRLARARQPAWFVHRLSLRS